MTKRDTWRLAAGCAMLAACLAGCSGKPDRVAVGQGELYYTAGVSRADAEAVSKHLADNMKFGARPMTAQLAYADRTYALRLVVVPGAEKRQDVRGWRVLGEGVSRECLRSAPVDVHLCDEGLKTLTLVRYDPLKPDLPVRVTFRRARLGGGLVAQYRNDSERHLLVRVGLWNATVGDRRDVTLALGPGQVKEHGPLDGWRYMSGEKITVVNSDYEPSEVTVP